MSILVGITREEISSSPSYGLDGFGGGFNSSFNNLTIIKEGTVEELKTYVKKELVNVKIAKLKTKKLENFINNEYDNSMSEEEYNKESSLIQKFNRFSKFKQVMIIEGEVLNINQD